jgi:hypothetical protein
MFFRRFGQIHHNLAQFILRGNQSAPVNFSFPDPVPLSGCLVFIFDGGPVSGTATFTMEANLKLEFIDVSDPQRIRTPVLMNAGHEFFPYQQIQRAMAYIQPIYFRGEVKQIYGNYSNKGTDYSITDFYALKGGCGSFKNYQTVSKLGKSRGYLEKPREAAGASIGLATLYEDSETNNQPKNRSDSGNS